MSTLKVIFWLTFAVCVATATYDFIKSGIPGYVWAFMVPCELKNTCQEGEK